MAAFDRARDMLDVGDRDRRYPPDDIDGNLEHISDPHQLEDETSRSLQETLIQYRWFFLAFGALTITLTVVLINYILRFIPALVQNQWVQRFSILLFVFGAGFVLGNVMTRSSLGNQERLDLVKPDGLTSFDGEYISAEEGSFPKFRPIKGYRLLGLFPQYYTYGDVSPKLARQVSKMGLDADDPIDIRLHPSMSETAKRDHGMIVAQLSSGLDVDPYGRETGIVASLPTLADESRITDLTDELTDLYEKYRNAVNRADMYRIQRNGALDEARDSRKEAIRDFVEDYRAVRSVEPARVTSSVDRSADTIGESLDESSIEEELQHD